MAVKPVASQRHDSDQGVMMSQELQEWREETEQIISELVDDGSDPEAQYAIEHHFASSSFDNLEKLAVDLYNAGFDVEDAEEVELDDGAVVFCFDATKEGTLDVERITDEIAILLPLCKKYKVDYDGWGTYFVD